MNQRSAECELAWAAGFFDGEGSTSAVESPDRNGRTRCQIQMQVGQNDPLLLHRFQAAVGVGRMCGPYRRRRTYGGGESYDRYFWSASSVSDVTAAFEKLRPYLGPFKIAQAEAAIAKRGPALPRGRKVGEFRSHCKHGHPFDGCNLVVRSGRRRCRLCLERRKRKKVGDGAF